MNLRFHNVTPAPLAGVIDFKTDVWQKDLTFVSGSRYNLEAPSGKGKTTFIHCLYGLRFDYTGEVRIDSSDAKNITSNQWSDLRKNHLSIVFQDLRLFLHLTARENLEVKSVLYKENIAAKIQAMADTLKVAHVLDKPARTLSYGERQRVAIMRSLLQPFDWILMDEPFSHLDAENTHNAAILIEQEVAARKAGMIVTSLGVDKHFHYQHLITL